MATQRRSEIMASKNTMKIHLLEPEKIVSAIDHYSHGTIRFVPDDLKTPNPEKLKTVYLLLVSIIFEVPRDELIHPKFDDLDQMSYAEIHEESIILMTTAMQIQSCFSCCLGINDFTVKDIIAPSPKRTHRLLSILIRFVAYLENQLEVRAAAMDKAGQMTQEMDDCLRQEDECRMAIEGIKERKIADQRVLEEMAPELNELTARCSELQMQERYDRKEFEKVQEKVGRQELFLETDQSSQTIKKLQDSIKESLELLKDFSEKEKVTGEFLENSQVVQSLIEEVARCLEKLHHVQAELDILRDKNLSKEHENKNAAAEIQNQRRQQTLKMDKMARVVVQYNKKVSCLNEQIEQLKRQRTVLEKSREEGVKRLQEFESHKTELENMVAQKRAEHQEKMSDMRIAYEGLLKQLDTYHTSLADSWMSIAPFYGLEKEAVA